MVDLAKKYKLGEKIKGYSVTKAIALEELQANYYELTHDKSGACVMHIEADDDENVFSILLRTLPKSDKGTPHILEHCVLCGSEKFPVKDPFFSMARRSVNTFMNAMTGNDFTCYPAASQVEKDFYNLLEVYIDAVFKPTLDELSFLQEGHRYEFEEQENPKSKLLHKGIVFNEMKGSLSSPESKLYYLTMKHLMPDLPYAYNFGGDPKVIPELTYEEFLDFHRQNYHPSRAIFFFYGNLPLENHLAFLEQNLLSSTEKLDKLPSIGKQERFSSPKKIQASYPAQEDAETNNTSFISFSFLTTPIENQDDILGLQLLESILMDTDASPLKNALITSKYCIQASSYLDTETSEAPLIITCKGCKENDAEALEKLLLSTLTTIKENGIEQKLVDSALHQLELSRTEISGDHYPFGLSLFFRSALPMMHGCPPENALTLHHLFSTLLEKTKDPSYLPNLIDKYLLKNPHFVRIVMSPNKDLAQEEYQDEIKNLEATQKKLSSEEKKNIIENAKKLENLQTNEPNVDCLPKIHIDDVPKETKSFPLSCFNIGNCKSYLHDCFTNHFTYVDIVTTLPKLTANQLQYAKLLSTIVADLGVEGKSYLETLNETYAHTGGIHASIVNHVMCKNPNSLNPAIHLRGKSLIRNAKFLISQMKAFMTSSDFSDKNRIKELILQTHTFKKNSLVKSGLSYAIDLCLSNYSMSAKMHYLMHGIKYYQFIDDLAKNIDSKLDEIIENLSDMKTKLFHNNNLEIVVSSSNADYDTLNSLEEFKSLDAMPKSSYTPWDLEYSHQEITSHAKLIPSTVAFTAMGFKTLHYPDPACAALTLATTLFENKILHQRIREQGGAYGSGCAYNPLSGHLYFYGYRDPHLASTKKAFSESITSIGSGNFSEEDLSEAKLSALQYLDHPISPGSRAIAEYDYQRTNQSIEERKNYRKLLLSQTKDSIQKVVNDALCDFNDKATFVTFCDENFFNEKSKELDIPLSLETI